MKSGQRQKTVMNLYELWAGITKPPKMGHEFTNYEQALLNQLKWAMNIYELRAGITKPIKIGHESLRSACSLFVKIHDLF